MRFIVAALKVRPHKLGGRNPPTRSISLAGLNWKERRERVRELLKSAPADHPRRAWAEAYIESPPKWWELQEPGAPPYEADR